MHRFLDLLCFEVHCQKRFLLVFPLLEGMPQLKIFRWGQTQFLFKKEEFVEAGPARTQFEPPFHPQNPGSLGFPLCRSVSGQNPGVANAVAAGIIETK